MAGPSPRRYHDPSPSDRSPRPHAAGVVIPDTPLIDLLHRPIRPEYQGHFVEALNLLREAVGSREHSTSQW
jgi:hypothetical protein